MKPLKNPLAELNSLQRQAVEHDNGHLLIVAGPGTGKTHTLAYRVGRMAQGLQAGEKILAVTFTNKAAEEMYQRLGMLAASTGSRVTSNESRATGNESLFLIGTFHHFCLDLLREFSTAAGLPAEFRVAEPEEILELSKEIWPGLKLRQRRDLLERISRWKSIGFDGPAPKENAGYSRAMRERGWLDFDDLLLETWNLLRHNPNIQTELHNRFRYVFVDEYQDINAVQRELLKMVIGPRCVLTAIGDPNQAIYGFRGSDVKFFEHFADDFPGAAVMTLAENYRSTENLLAASGQVMARGRSRFVPELTARIYAQGHLIIQESPTDKAEAEYVVHQIERLVGGTSMFSQDSGRVTREQEGERSFGDIAVLYRLNSQARILKTAFARSGIPFQIAAEVKETADDEALPDDPCPPRGIEISTSAEKVSLMSIHAAKGLEFPVVFIVGCEDHLLPLDVAGMSGDIQEERRLFYVGMTRAKERLYLVRAGKRMLYGRTYENAASPFVADIEEELKKFEADSPVKKRKHKEQMELF